MTPPRFAPGIDSFVQAQVLEHFEDGMHGPELAGVLDLALQQRCRWAPTLEEVTQRQELLLGQPADASSCSSSRLAVPGEVLSK